MALPEKTKIWSAIKAALPAINKSGSNGIEVLMWSQDKGLEEVKQKLREIIMKVENKDETEISGKNVSTENNRRDPKVGMSKDQRF
jgi:hypothetical protein